MQTTVSVLLLGLLALKTGGLLTTFASSKCFSAVKLCLDVEEPEKEENKETKNQNKTMVYLATTNKDSIGILEKDVKVVRHRCNRIFCMEHYGSVPSPPPDPMA